MRLNALARLDLRASAMAGIAIRFDKRPFVREKGRFPLCATRFYVTPKGKLIPTLFLQGAGFRPVPRQEGRQDRPASGRPARAISSTASWKRNFHGTRVGRLRMSYSRFTMSKSQCGTYREHSYNSRLFCLCDSAAITRVLRSSATR